MTEWSIERQQELVSLYQSGRSMAECCSILKAGQIVVQRYLLRNGVQPRPAHRKGPSQELIDTCVAMREAGSTQIEISRKVGISSSFAKQILVRAGVQPNHPHWTESRRNELVEHYRSGKNVAQCARLMNTGRKTIRHQLKVSGVPRRPLKDEVARLDKHPNWKGGRNVGRYVYVRAVDHPNATKHGYVLEHHLVMEGMIGRFLRPGEVVHHKDKNRLNNDPGNLQLFSSNGKHLEFELKGKTPRWTEQGRKRTIEGHQRWCEQQRKKSRSKVDDQG